MIGLDCSEISTPAGRNDYQGMLVPELKALELTGSLEAGGVLSSILKTAVPDRLPRLRLAAVQLCGGTAEGIGVADRRT